MSFDDLYNNFKIVEQEVKRTISSSSNSSSRNMAFMSSPSSTNKVNTTNIQVSTTSKPVTTASHNDNNANLSDAIVFAFLANQPNGSQLVHEDLEQIHEDDLEEIDLKWKLALLSMRARRVQKSKAPRKQTKESRQLKKNYKEVPTNMARMAFSDSEVLNDKTCSNTCLKKYETLKAQYDNLRIELNKSEFDLANYKRGLASVEEQLVFYKKNEVENLKKEKESNKIKIDSFENASKSLDKLTGSQISDNNRKCVGFESYNVEFQKPEFEGYGLNVNKSVSENSSNETKKNTSAPLIKEWFSDSDEDEYEVKESKNVQHKPEQVNQPRQVNKNPRNNRTNGNEKKTQKLGVGFQVTKKACFVCGSFNHLIKDCDFHDKKMVQKPMLNNEKKGTGPREVRPVWNNAIRTNHQNFSNSKRNFEPTAVLTKSGLVPTNTARQSSSRVAVPVSTARPINTAAPKTFVNVAKPRPNAFQKSHSPSRRLVNFAKGKRVTSAVRKQRSNVVKSSACWVWRPTGKVIDHVSKNSGSYICKKFEYVDPIGRLKVQVDLKDTGMFNSGCSRHMTGNKSYLTDYEDYDGGFVAFASSSK
ncbi:hypothetical protein Tco_1068134 [Tanacetum coccineum]|uniref:Uncharacterized protein n=1 Tax=Tanacetum coccineum TaxID=301880 RepID=A0ABQ5HEV2_9ASTR